jgi:predicted Zn-dependent peptidase
MVIAGFFGAEQDQIEDQRFLSLAAKILTTRMVEGLREDKQLVYSIAANSSGALEFPGYGTFYAFSSTAPEKVDALLADLAAMYADFAAKGPADDELAVAKRQIANLLDERMREPAFWTAALATLTYRGQKLQDTVDAPAAYDAASADQVRETFARYFRPEGSFTVAVIPTAPTEPAPPK